MNSEKALAVFENFKIRRVYDEKLEIWYFSVVVTRRHATIGKSSRIA